MKPLFVSVKENQRVIHWPKLTAFAVVVMVLSMVIAEVCWYVLAGHASPSALILGLVLGLLIVIRAVVRAVTFQELELENIPSTT
jgi:hypothetical protein